MLQTVENFWKIAQQTPFTPEVDFGGLGKISTGASGIGSFVNNLVLWMVGVAAFVSGLMIVINGIKFITAMGDEQKIKDALDGMKSAIFGFLLAILASGIVWLIDSML